ncbi:MAG: PQQ-binding-like beta-propeller repeat protein [Phycisphaerales bacterium]|nr:MAG: PQQ-binding-like beta-propeller repeat protein [Phycisphaerales bacterium]
MLMKSPLGVSVVAVLTLTFAALAESPTSHWPSFRGPNASGIDDGDAPPTTWDAETGTNIKWKTAIPGLAHSSPIVWGERVFITSAVSSDPDPYLRVGLYGESPDHPEEIVHKFNVYCLDKKSGKILWEQTANSAIPKVKRHIKSTHANSTPATDGKHVIAFFGSEGFFCYDVSGKLLWKKDLGHLNAGAFNAPEVQWAFGSSPIIHGDKVIVQCDVNDQSFLATFDVETGKELWRTPRDAHPCWGTPTVHEGATRQQIIVNGYEYMGGYDLNTGKELWRLKGGGDVPVPTPYVAHDLIFLTSAHGPYRPIYAIHPNANGDISMNLQAGETSNEYIAWCRPKRGSYIPTSIVYGDYLYVGDDRGILTCYQAKTGEKVYRERLAGTRGGAYSASPVACGGKIYFTAEEGDIHVLKAGPQYELLASNSMGGVCLATPAISDGMIFIRTSKDLFGIGQ